VGQDDQRVRRIKQYVLARLREELANAPRGSQARLAERLGVSGAHLSNMLSSTPSRQPGEDFRRKVAAHWGVSYAQLEALALGEDPPPSMLKPTGGRTEAVPPNLAAAIGEYSWMRELPLELRDVVREQARLHYAYARYDYPREEWQRIVTGLEREALALVARARPDEEEPPPSPRSDAHETRTPTVSQVRDRPRREAQRGRRRR
jgi:transcriptional regulator with XRE-family HTH domain